MSKHTVLTEEQIAKELSDLPDWSVTNGNIEATFTLATFKDAISFIDQVAVLAEEMNHHPEFCNSYNKVSFSYCTHDVGYKITNTDVEMAMRISEIRQNFST